ncbi:MAG: hypothetical protein KBC35_01650 [Candidatus Pacebacteria bacterium]|jgi:hypothetical protein|nr:hypothetical protein [Candidatus Paceibacterota bacterium]
MQDDHKIIEPNFEGEKMKMPENSGTMPVVEQPRSTIINGPLLLVLALLLIIILGGMYYWFSTLTIETAPIAEPSRPTAAENNEPESTTAEAQVDMLEVTSPSDEITAIEADLEATNLDTLDSDLRAIDAEVEAALQE